MPCITSPTLSGTFHFSLPTTNMHDESIYPSSTHYTALLTTHANAWTPTHYPSTAPQHMPTSPMPCGCYHPSPPVQLQYHTGNTGRRSMTDDRPCVLDRVSGSTDRWSVRPRHQITRILIVGLSLRVVISKSGQLRLGDFSHSYGRAPKDQDKQYESFCP
jgi:hypothetical protein